MAALRPVANDAVTRPLLKRPPGTRYRTLLSIDGGGLRGVIPAIVLGRLETEIKDYIVKNRHTLVPEMYQSSVQTVEDFDIDLTDYFDLVSGTSVGSWLASYIASRGKGSESMFNNPNIIQKHGRLRPGSMKIVPAIVEEYAPTVFPRRNIFTTVARLFRPLYPADGIESVLQQHFGDTTMRDLETGLLVTSYDIRRNVACSFLRGPGNDAQTYTVRTAVRECPRESNADSAALSEEQSHRVPQQIWIPDLEIVPGTNYRLRDIALASSSAPTYFRPATISPIDGGEELTLVDGGLVANNPTLQALTYAPSAFDTGRVQDVAIFSVGCGTVDPRQSRNADPGIGWWVGSGNLLDALQNGSGEYIQAVVDYWLYRNVGVEFGQYLRIQKSAPPETEMGRIFGEFAAVDDIPRLIEYGNLMADDNIQAIRNFIQNFIFRI